MSNENDKSTESTSKEAPTTHARKAQITGLILIGVVAVGLIINTVANYSKREQRQANRAAEQEKAEERQTEVRPLRTINDFAAEQQQAAQAIKSDDQAKKEEEKRATILDRVTNRDGGNAGAAGNAQEKKTPADVEAEFKAEERKRVLDAMRGPIGRLSAAREAANVEQPTTQGAVAQVDQQLNALTANQQAVEQRKRALIERAQSMGIDLPAMIAGKAGSLPVVQTSAMQAAAQGTAAPAGRAASAGAPTFGELAINRVERNPANSGPKPGEKIIPTGTIVSAVLDMDMISDYAGNWIALVQRPVYDVELENILMPAGTKIVGKSIRATGPNEFIQNRMGAVPLWAIRPDGKRIDFKLTSSMDAAGVAALQGSVDRHFLAQFMGIGAYAIIGLGPSMSNFGAEPQSSRDAFVREATGKSREIGRAFAEKYLNVVPTQKIYAGTPVKIFIEDDIYVTPWAEIDATHFNVH